MNDTKKLKDALKWCLKNLDRLVYFTSDGSAYIRQVDGRIELAGFKRKYNEVKELVAE